MSSPLEFVIRLEEDATPAFDVGGLPVPSSTPSSQPSPPQEDPARKALEDAQLADLQRRSLATASGREADASLSQSASVSDLLAAQMAELQQQHAQAVRRASESAAESAAAGFVGGRSDIRRVQQLEAQMAELQRQIAAPQVEEIRPELDIRPEPPPTPAFNLQPVQEAMRDLDRDLAREIGDRIKLLEEVRGELEEVKPPTLKEIKERRYAISIDEQVLAERREREEKQRHEELLNEARARLDPYQVPQQKDLFGPPEPIDLQPKGFVGPIQPPETVEQRVLREKLEREEREAYEKELNEARARLDPYQVPQQKGLVGPPEPPPLAITPQVEADKRQKDAALRANFEADVLRSRDVDEDARRMKQQADSREEYNKDLQQARNRLDPEDARERDMKAAGNLAQQAGVPGGRALGNISEASKLPEALEGIGEAGGLEAAAGPIGAVIAIADEAGKALAGQMDGARKSIELFGQTVGDAARNDYAGALGRNVDAAAESLKKIPIVGQVWAAELELAVAPVRAFTAVVESFVDRGKQLSQFSAELQFAQANVEVRGIMGDMNEAAALGPGIARLTEAQDQVWHEFRTLFLPVKEFIVNDLALSMENIRDMIVWTKGALKTIVDAHILIVKTLPLMPAKLEEILKALSKALGTDSEDINMDLFSTLKDILGGDGRDARFAAPAVPRAAGPLDIPGVRGGF